MRVYPFLIFLFLSHSSISQNFALSRTSKIDTLKSSFFQCLNIKDSTVQLLNLVSEDQLYEINFGSLKNISKEDRDVLVTFQEIFLRYPNIELAEKIFVEHQRKNFDWNRSEPSGRLKRITDDFENRNPSYLELLKEKDKIVNRFGFYNKEVV